MSWQQFSAQSIGTIEARDVCVDKEGLVFANDCNGGLSILEYKA